MNIQDAYKILGIAPDIDDEALKSKYKELAKQYHPDIYKEDPDKFKIINEAYQTVQEYRTNPPTPFRQGFRRAEVYDNEVPQGFGFNINDFFAQSQPRRTMRNVSAPEIQLSISFIESVMGCVKEIDYIRWLKCATCNGEGMKKLSNGCTVCDGFGRINQSNGNMFISRTCNKCNGRNIGHSKCIDCKGDGIINNKVSGSINIPAGVNNQQILRLQGNMGSYIGPNLFGGDSYSDVLVNINVEEHKEFKLVGLDIVSNLDISLKEALTGCIKNINTAYGSEDITIISQTKHKDEIRLNNKGVKGTSGSHIVVIKVNYPNDLLPLLNILN